MIPSVLTNVCIAREISALYFCFRTGTICKFYPECAINMSGQTKESNIKEGELSGEVSIYAIINTRETIFGLLSCSLFSPVSNDDFVLYLLESCFFKLQY